MKNEELKAKLIKQIEEEETALFYEEIANDFLYTCGNGHELRNHILQLRKQLESLD